MPQVCFVAARLIITAVKLILVSTISYRSMYDNSRVFIQTNNLIYQVTRGQKRHTMDNAKLRNEIPDYCIYKQRRHRPTGFNACYFKDYTDTMEYNSVETSIDSVGF